MNRLTGLLMKFLPGACTARSTSPSSARPPRGVLPLLAAAVVVAAACTDEPTAADNDRAQLVPTDYQIIEGFALTQTVDGIRNAEIVADSTWQWADSTAFRLFGVQMNFFDSLGVRTARATAQQARLDTESQDMELRGNAVLNVLTQNTTIQSPVLYYAPESDLIRSDTVTRAVIDGEPITGTRFESDLQFRNITIDNPVGAIPNAMMDTVGTTAPPVGVDDRGVDDGGRGLDDRGGVDDGGRGR